MEQSENFGIGTRFTGREFADASGGEDQVISFDQVDLQVFFHGVHGSSNVSISVATLHQTTHDISNQQFELDYGSMLVKDVSTPLIVTTEYVVRMSSRPIHTLANSTKVQLQKLISFTS